jgi:hypothetical protein
MLDGLGKRLYLFPAPASMPVPYILIPTSAHARTFPAFKQYGTTAHVCALKAKEKDPIVSNDLLAVGLMSARLQLVPDSFIICGLFLPESCGGASTTSL